MKHLVTLLAIVALTGCISTPMQWGASGGSRADGIVELSYTYNYMQKPITSEVQGRLRAAQMCLAWGYVNGVEPMDVDERKCESSSYNGCDLWRVTRKYQCL